MAAEPWIVDDNSPVYNYHQPAIYSIDATLNPSPQPGAGEGPEADGSSKLIFSPVAMEYVTPSSAHSSHTAWETEAGYTPSTANESDCHGQQWVPAYWSDTSPSLASTSTAGHSLPAPIPHAPISWLDQSSVLVVDSSSVDHGQRLQPAPPVSGTASTSTMILPPSPAVPTIQRKRMDSVNSNSDPYASDDSDAPPANSSVSEDASPGTAATRYQALPVVPRPIRPRRDDSDIPPSYTDDRAVARYRHKKSQAESSLRRRQAMQDIDKILRQSGVDVHGAPRQLRAFLDLYK
jgi:hypothetical protein